MNRTEQAMAQNLANREAVSPLHGFLPVLSKLLIQRLLSIYTLIFAIGFPLLMYLIFGSGQAYTKIELAHGTVGATILVSLAQYGTATAAAMLQTGVAIEKIQGWLRTMALTPMGVSVYIWVRMLMGTLVVAISMAVLYLCGMLTGTKMEPTVWLQTYLISLMLCSLPALMGLFAGLAVGGEDAYGIIGGGMAIFAFLSGMFIPLEQLSSFFQKLAQFTPFWGMNRLASLPIYGWENFSWKYLVNLIVWLAIFALGTLWAANRSTKR